ncbi:MAG TPA: polyphosphate kinase [Saprospiraceae bacterium]|nr:polyphosphate kinase [Saprospiraceae bacterium]
MVRLSEFSTVAPSGIRKQEIQEETRIMASRIGELAEILHAENKRSVLVILQGMDCSGKDGSAKNVFQACSPMHCHGIGFKKPTDEEFARDFLWRVHRHTPRNGMITVFNRSHYEDVLIQRVHQWITEDQVTDRICAINAFEKLLIKDNDTSVLKFYMHISYEKQGEKLQDRIDNPDNQWKHNEGDWRERKYWKDYRVAYEDVINRSEVPWIIVPADQRWYRNHFIAKHVLQTMESLDMKKPLLGDG